jgi:hypothetical protein
MLKISLIYLDASKSLRICIVEYRVFLGVGVLVVVVEEDCSIKIHVPLLYTSSVREFP